MSSGAFSSRALRIGATCRREAIIALNSSKKSPLYPSGRRKIAMLPTCIGISGVSRYRNDASMEDSFLASLIGSLPRTMTLHLGGVYGFGSGVETIPSTGQDCARSDGAYAMAKGPDRPNWLN